MFPTLTLLNLQIPMTGVGIVLFIALFWRATQKYAKRNQLDKSQFNAYRPLYLVVIYVFSSYMYFLIEEFVIFPTSVQQLLAYISPQGYQFHVVGIVFACIGCAYHFLTKQVNKTIQMKRIDTRFLSLSVASIPFGLFLLLGDHFIGVPRDGILQVSTLTSESAWSAYGGVFPLGLGLSLLGILCYLGAKFLSLSRPQARGYGLLGSAFWCFGFHWILVLQSYPRRLVMPVGNMTRDIKNYVILGVMCLLLLLYLRKYRYFSDF